MSGAGSVANLVNIPHVAGVDGGSSLPPGEHCYQCGQQKGFDKTGAGVPLTKRAERQRRDAHKLLTDITLLPPASELVIDVSGPHAELPANVLDQEDSVLDDNLTLINAADLRRLSLIAQSTAASKSSSALPAHSVIYVHRNVTGPEHNVVQIMSAVKTDDEVCKLKSARQRSAADDAAAAADDVRSLFTVHHAESVTSLQFRSAQRHSVVYELRLKCRSLVDRTQLTMMNIEVHVV